MTSNNHIYHGILYRWFINLFGTWAFNVQIVLEIYNLKFNINIKSGQLQVAHACSVLYIVTDSNIHTQAMNTQTQSVTGLLTPSCIKCVCVCVSVCECVCVCVCEQGSVSANHMCCIHVNHAQLLESFS